MVVVGAGPIGLALARELSRLGARVVVLDKRTALTRPQLLVARAGDLANLSHLGVDIGDPKIVSMLATRCEGDLASGRSVRGDVLYRAIARVDLWALVAQPPIALVPIGRLQQALAQGVDVRPCEVVQLRRHAGSVSIRCANGETFRAGMAIIATGAGSYGAPVVRHERQLVAGVFDVHGEQARWARVEVPVHASSARCTLLQTSRDTAAGTALLVEPPIGTDPIGCFDIVARAHGLVGSPMIAAPQPFVTAVSALPRRAHHGDGRAPLVVAGDAAQTGHVFSGQNCFVNLALALDLVERLRGGDVADALAGYEAKSEIGAALMAHASQRHHATHRAGAWAFAGVATA